MARKTSKFEIFGRVQGVFFRKYTKREADKLKLGGWCENTKNNTVRGHLEGTEESINQMKTWLTSKGSPSSKISKAEFTPNKEIEKPVHESFVIRK